MIRTRRLRGAVAVGAIAVLAPFTSCSDSPTLPSTKGPEANFTIQHTEQFDANYVVYVVPDYYGMCWNLIGPSGWGTYYCDDQTIHPKFLANSIYVEAFAEPDFEANITVYVEDPELQVKASCTVGYEDYGTLCRAQTQHGTWDEQVLTNVRWELGSSSYSQSGPATEFFWSTSTPPNGGTVQLSYTLDQYISGQRTIPVASAPGCEENPGGSTAPSSGTLDEGAFVNWFSNNAAPDYTGAKGRCAEFVRKAFCAGGLTAFCDGGGYPGLARQYATWLSSTSMNWTKIYDGYDPNGWCKRVGDVAVFMYQLPGEDPIVPGHVSVWDGSRWVSDHYQNSVFPKQSQVRYFTVWRRPGVSSC
jgi:hypothetical protein